jgi:signal transduction histidine kinase
MAQSEGLKLSYWPDGREPPPTVEADPDRLQQVLLILVDNAMKHTPPGGTVDVRVRRRGHSAEIEVADSGVGIAAEHLPRVFDRFYRADKARVAGGSGLGLSIVQEIVKAHHGRVEVASEEGVGTTVSVWLPASG